MLSRLAIIILFLNVATAYAGPSATEQYFAGLRQRGLFDLAEGEALRRLSQPDLLLDQQALLVAELARTFSEHAKYTTGQEQEDLWERSESLIDDFLKTNSHSPHQVQLERLNAELELSRAQMLRWLSELVPEQPKYRVDAQKILGSVVDTLSKTEESLKKRLSNRLRLRTERTETLTPTDLNDELLLTQLLLGTAELERARLTFGDERDEHLAHAENWLRDLAKGATALDSTWQAQTLLAESARIAGRHDVVRRRLAALEPALLSNAARDASAAVSAKLLIDEGKPDRAVAFLIDYRRTRGALTGELRLIQIEGLAAAAERLARSENKRDAQALRDEIPKVVSWTEAEHGGFWAYRARLAAREVERSSRFGIEVAEQVNRAEAATSLGQPDAAIAAYAEASRLASDDRELAADFAYRRASILLQAERWEEASDAFTQVAIEWPDSQKASEAHLLAAYALGRLHDEDPSTARREAYIASLEEHRTKFSGTSSAAEATLRLARLYEQRRQYSQAIRILPEALHDPDHATRAAASLARNYESLLRYLNESYKSAPNPAEANARASQIEEWSAKAERDLLAATEPLQNAGSAEQWSPGQAELALRSARILLRRPGGQAVANRLLERLASTVDEPHPANEATFWSAVRQSMLPLRIVSLSSEQRFTEADQLLDSLQRAPIGDVLAVIRALAELTDRSSQNGRPVVFGASDGPVGPRLDDLRDVASQLLADRRSELSSAQAAQLDLLLAKTSLATGDSSAAIARYRAALAEHPDDKRLLTQAAATLLASGDLPAVEQARDYWRRLEKLEKPGTSAWIDARMKVIEADLSLGNLAEARKLLTVTKLLHPALGDPQTRVEFQRLEQRVNAQTAATQTESTR